MDKIVVIGGGTGSHTVLSGLKNYPVALTAIVTVADSGGSTGRLRDEFGYLPVGDFRMALVALASSDADGELLRDLFLYRFNKGGVGLKGHNFGNLFLVALADLHGSYEKALETVSSILRIDGRIIPVAPVKLDLIAQYEDGSVIEGETNIDEPPKSHDGTQRIIKLWTKPDASSSKEAIGAILDADYIILGPGDMYTSILANMAVRGIPTAIRKSSAKVIYLVNLMTKYGQTHAFTAGDHVEEIKSYLGKYPDYVIINKGNLPNDILSDYKKEKDYPVEDDLSKYNGVFKVIRKNLLASGKYFKPSGDIVKRSLIRHDPSKIAWQIMKIVNDD